MDAVETRHPSHDPDTRARLRILINETGVAMAGRNRVALSETARPAIVVLDLGWAQHFLSQYDLLVYVGDGSSDV